MAVPVRAPCNLFTCCWCKTLDCSCSQTPQSATSTPGAAAQVLVVACVLLVVPRGSTRAAFISRLAPDTFSKRAEQMADSIPPGQGRDVFCIVFDAGSTGAKQRYICSLL